VSRRLTWSDWPESNNFGPASYLASEDTIGGWSHGRPRERTLWHKPRLRLLVVQLRCLWHSGSSEF